MIKRINIAHQIKVKTVSDLVDSPVVIRLKKFNDESSDKFYEDVCKAHETGQPVLPIVVDSYGGEVYSLLGMITEIQNCRIPVATICETKAMSAGAILFGFGNVGMRFMSPHATLMIHEVSNCCFGKVEEIKADTANTDRLNTYVFEQLATHCQKSKEYLLNLLHDKAHADWYLDAKAAKKYGVCDHIKVPSFEMNINVEYKFG
jgi:ATP-dependent Clp protease protease subunit